MMRWVKKWMSGRDCMNCEQRLDDAERMVNILENRIVDIERVVGAERGVLREDLERVRRWRRPQPQA